MLHHCTSYYHFMNSAAAFIGRDRDLMKKIDKDVLIAGMQNLSREDMDPKSVST